MDYYAFVAPVGYNYITLSNFLKNYEDVSMVERLLAIVKQKGLSVSAVEKKLGFGNGAIKRFSTSSPSVDKIITLSNFLNVTVEYILFGNENFSELPEDIKI